MQKGRVAMAGNSGKWRRLIMAIAAVLYCSLGHSCPNKLLKG